MTVPLHTIDLGKRYGRQWALRDCSLTLPQGRVGALVGPNGAGKTTLLQLAVGLTIPGILSPVTGALLHELSSIPVIANSARLIGLKEKAG